MRKKPAHDFKFEPRWTAGYREFRYSEMHIGARTYDLKSRITLAGPKPKPIFRGEKRTHVVTEAMNVMRDWRLSPFEHEGATRAGMRSSLCLDGYDWQRADHAAADIVKECLHRLGAQHPTYLQGQREYAVAREFCRGCMGPLDDEAITARYSFCSEECRQSVRTRNNLLYHRLMLDTRNCAARIKANAEAAPRHCSECGKSYRAANPDQKVCSRECGVAARTYLAEKPCKWCGHMFRPRDASKTFCSRECGAAHSTKVRVQTMPDITCAVCKSIFRKRSPMGKYCSSACKSVADNAARKLPERIGHCEECGAAFIRKRSDKRWCNQNCMNKTKRRQEKEAQASAFFCEAAE